MASVEIHKKMWIPRWNFRLAGVSNEWDFATLSHEHMQPLQLARNFRTVKPQLCLSNPEAHTNAEWEDKTNATIVQITKYQDFQY